MAKPIDPMTVDFRALQVLLRVHKLRSFTGASEELGVNQSAVSYTIDKLRSVFNDPLFVRQARQLQPTERCEEITEHCARLVTDFQQMTALGGFDPKTVDQTFTIACNFYERVLMIPQIVHQLKLEAPNLKLEIIDASGIGHKRLMDNEADLLIGPFERDDPNFYQRGLFHDRYVCMLDQEHPLAGQPLSMTDYLGLDHVVVTYGGHWQSRYLIELERLGHELSIALRVPSPAGLKSLVAGSSLVATLPERLSQEVGKDLSIAECPFNTRVAIKLVWTSLTHKSALNMWVRDRIYSMVTAENRSTA